MENIVFFRSIECVRQFPEVYGCLAGSTVVRSDTRWLSGAHEKYSGHWRSTKLDSFLQLFPCISEQVEPPENTCAFVLETVLHRQYPV